MTDDNIIYFSKDQPNIDKIDASAVEVLCDIAGRHLDDVVILGSDKETGAIKMMTTQEDVADILFYLEVAKKAILDQGVHDGVGGEV